MSIDYDLSIKIEEAIDKKNYKTIQFLIDNDTSENIQDEVNIIPELLDYIIRLSFYTPEVTKYLLRKKLFNPNYYLHDVVFNNHYEALKLFSEYGVNLNYEDEYYTTLEQVTTLKMIKLLLSLGLDVSDIDAYDYVLNNNLESEEKVRDTIFNYQLKHVENIKCSMYNSDYIKNLQKRYKIKMTFNKFVELVKKDERKKVLDILESKEIEPKDFTNIQCEKLHDSASVKVFEKLIEYGLDINFAKSEVLRKAMSAEKSTYAKYLTIAVKNGQEIRYPEKFNYSHGGDIKYLYIQKVKLLFSLPNFPMVKSDFTDYVGCIGDKYREVPKTVSFQKFFDKICPDEYFVDYFNEEMGWHYNSLQNNLLKELYKRKKILTNITISQKNSLVKTLNSYCHIDIKLLYKFINLKVLTKEQYQQAIQKKPLSKSDTEFLEKKGISFISDKINDILKKDINSLTFEEESEILYAQQVNDELSKYLIRILENSNNKLKDYHYIDKIQRMTDFKNINDYLKYGSFGKKIMELLINSNKIKSEYIKEPDIPSYTLPKNQDTTIKDEEEFVKNVIRLWSHKKFEHKTKIYIPLLFAKFNKSVQLFCSEILQSNEYFISLGNMKSYIWENVLEYYPFESVQDFANLTGIKFNLFEKIIELKKFDLLKKIIKEFLDKDEKEIVIAHLNSKVVNDIKELSILDKDEIKKIDKVLDMLKEYEKFIYTVANNDLDSFKTYLKDGWDINKFYPLEDSNFYSVLEIAVFNENHKVLDILLKHNVELNTPNIDGEYILEKAFNWSLEFIEKLIENGAYKIKNIDNTVFKILNISFINKEEEKEKQAIEKLELLKKINDNFILTDSTLLNQVYCFKYRTYEVVKFLLENGLDVNNQNNADKITNILRCQIKSQTNVETHELGHANA